MWSLDERLADIISKHLHAFLKVEKGPNGGCPHIIVNQVGEEKAHGTWLQMIRKMIYAFDEYQSVPDKYNIEPEKEVRIKEGMQLFIDYFKDFPLPRHSFSKLGSALGLRKVKYLWI